MIVAIPFVLGLTDYKNLASELRKRGNLPGHTLLVISEQEDEEAAHDFGMEIADLFTKSAFKILPVAPRKAIRRANDLFRYAVLYVRNHVPGEGEGEHSVLLYFDATYRPQKNGWLDTLQGEYFRLQTPLVMGVANIDMEGARIFQGPVVIASGFADSSGLLDFLPENDHWRTHLRWELTRCSKETACIGRGTDSVLKIAKK